jgi:hypothetical protein
MPTNDFLAFAIGVGANVDTQAAYAARTSIISLGQSAGVVPSVLLNKINRQGSVIANVVAQYICDQSGLDALDNGAPSTLLANLKTAIAAQIDAQSGNYAIDTGAANAYVVALSPPITAWPDGLTFRFRVTHANTGASTINAGPGAVALNNNVNAALVAGDLPVGTIVTATYVVALGNCVVNTVVVSQALTKAQADLLYAPINGSVAAVRNMFSNLKADAIGVNNYNCVVTIDEIVLENSSNSYLTLRAVNKTINANGTVGAPLSIMSTRAASTWYYRWLWYNVTNGLTATLDISSTAPTAPTGYVAGDYKAPLPGACRTDNTGNTYLLQTITRNRSSQYVVLAGSNVAAPPQMANGIAGSTTVPTWVAVAVAAFVPPTATKISIYAGSAGGSAQVIAAPNNQYGSITSSTNQPPISINAPATSIPATWLLEGTNIYFAGSASGANLECTGWEDNI